MGLAETPPGCTLSVDELIQCGAYLTTVPGRSVQSYCVPVISMFQLLLWSGKTFISPGVQTNFATMLNEIVKIPQRVGDFNSMQNFHFGML